MPLGETIVAQGTPQGESAIAAIRLSGPLVPQLFKEIFGIENVVWRKAYYRSYKSIKKDKIDEVIVIPYPKRSSYTGEESLEIYPHGNPLICRLIIDDLVSRGCRLASPGEFTRTAFVNGKMELTQAEAVADLIHARSLKSISYAQKQLSGNLGSRIIELRQLLLQIMALVEAYIDFPEEDLPLEQPEGPYQKLLGLQSELKALLDTYQYREFLQNGLSLSILGQPNAGKSSLLNSLMGEDRAIVSDQPGTTRDYIQENLFVGDYPVRIADTAGLREGQSEIEILGIEKSMNYAKDSDIILLVIDSSTLIAPSFDASVLSLLEQKPVLIVENKSDLALEPDWLDGYREKSDWVRVSTLTGDGISELREKLEKTIDHLADQFGNEEMIINARHQGILSDCLSHVDVSIQGIETKIGVELVSQDLRMALSFLSQVVGEDDNEEMLDHLFSQFCIGK